jgi:hypothetical protein
MWLVGPAIGVLWGFLLVLGSSIIFFLSQTTTGGTRRGIETYKVLSIWALGLLTHLGLLGYFAYWALSNF